AGAPQLLPQGGAPVPAPRPRGHAAAAPPGAAQLRHAGDLRAGRRQGAGGGHQGPGGVRRPAVLPGGLPADPGGPGRQPAGAAPARLPPPGRPRSAARSASVSSRPFASRKTTREAASLPGLPAPVPDEESLEEQETATRTGKA